MGFVTPLRWHFPLYLSFSFLYFLLVIFCSRPVLANFEANKSPIIFGQSAAFSGPNRELGQDMQTGILAAFTSVNRMGGVQGGHRLELISLDDAYEPTLALNNTVRLVEELDAFTMLGTVGTPTAVATFNPYLVPKKVPFVSPFTGARFLRYPFDDEHPGTQYAVNIRASYDDEVAAFVNYCVQNGHSLISIFYQNDGYGRAGLNALETVLTNRNLVIHSRGTYERNTEIVRPGFEEMQRQTGNVLPQAVVMVGTARALSAFLSLALDAWPLALFHTVSFVGAEVFAQVQKFQFA